jgi:uncharacterized protein
MQKTSTSTISHILNAKKIYMPLLSVPLANAIRLTKPPVKKKRIMTQRWSKLLFLHWEYPAAEIQKMLPEGLFIDTYAGKAYVGVVSFVMSHIRPFGLPSVYKLSSSLELNLRTYVYDRDKNPGVWFLSLDASSPLLVWLARNLFHLPYFNANQKIDYENDQITFSSKRHKSDKANELVFKPNHEKYQGNPGSLDFFLTSRYLLFSYNAKKGNIYKGRIYHKPYELKSAKIVKYDTHLFSMDHLTPPLEKPCSIVYCDSADVEIFNLQPI